MNFVKTLSVVALIVAAGSVSAQSISRERIGEHLAKCVANHLAFGLGSPKDQAKAEEYAIAAWKLARKYISEENIRLVGAKQATLTDSMKEENSKETARSLVVKSNTLCLTFESQVMSGKFD